MYINILTFLSESYLYRAYLPGKQVLGTKILKNKIRQQPANGAQEIVSPQVVLFEKTFFEGDRNNVLLTA
jgi:hypothetical protein